MKKPKTIQADKITSADKINSQEASVRKPKLSKLWKIVAIVVIVAFALLMISSALNVHRFKASFVKPTEAQVEAAKNLAIQALESGGMNSSEYDIYVPEMAPRLPGSERTILEVLFSSKTMTHSYLVDINSGEVMRHTFTEVFVPCCGRENLSKRPGLRHIREPGPRQ